MNQSASCLENAYLNANLFCSQSPSHTVQIANTRALGLNRQSVLAVRCRGVCKRIMLSPTTCTAQSSDLGPS